MLSGAGLSGVNLVTGACSILASWLRLVWEEAIMSVRKTIEPEQSAKRYAWRDGVYPSTGRES